MKSISFTIALCLSSVAGTLAATQDGNPSSLNAAKDHKRVIAARVIGTNASNIPFSGPRAHATVPDAKDHKATVAARAPIAKDHKHTEAARDHNPVQAAHKPTFVTLVARPKDHKHIQAAVVSCRFLNPEPTQVD